jgi:predicted RNase H-like HicB family nuclease
MTNYVYSVVLIPEEDSYVVHVPALPGCVTQGRSVEDALAMARDAIGLWLHGDPPHPESTGTKALLATIEVDVDVVDGVVRTPGVTERQPQPQPQPAGMLRS